MEADFTHEAGENTAYLIRGQQRLVKGCSPVNRESRTSDLDPSVNNAKQMIILQTTMSLCVNHQTRSYLSMELKQMSGDAYIIRSNW